MTEPVSKKRKIKGDDGVQHAKSGGVTDPRFSNIQSDPRYRLPSKRRDHVKVDKRFAHMLRDDDFARKAKVDRYGRPLPENSERKRLQRRYHFDDGIEDDEEVQKELKRVESGYDPIRDGGYSESSSSEQSSSDDENIVEEGQDETTSLGNHQEGDVAMGEATSRIAAVNLDWDNIRADDLMAVFSSFLPPAGHLHKVSVYPSQFGKERMEREEMEGPPKEIFASASKNVVTHGRNEENEDEGQVKDSMLQPDAGEDFDSATLRQYQLQRLQYYYAVLTFSSADVARTVYDAVDGTEYLATANFFDLRFIPDETDFTNDKPRDECEKIPERYKPNAFVTGALQHSNVKLTWDAEDASRKEAQAEAFRGSRRDIDENDLKAYLASDSSNDEEVFDESRGESNGDQSKKTQERLKMRTLLGLGPEPKQREKGKDGPVGGLEITFSSGLSVANGAKRSVFENEPDPEETTVEKYVRKERERKQKRKERIQNTQDGADATATDGQAGVEQNPPELAEDLGFDDPFFAAPEHDKASASRIRKEERLKKRAEREAEEAAVASKRAELELLMVDDKDDAQGVKHFDMDEIEREEKWAKKKGKKNQKKKLGKMGSGVQDAGFTMNTHDPRFARLYESHEFAIDPSNPRFRGTEGMKALLEEGKKHRLSKGLGDEQPSTVVKVSASKGQDHTKDVRQLVEKVKRKGSNKARP